MIPIRPALLIVLLVALAGCQQLPRDPHTYREGSRIMHKPVVAVLQFENRSGFHGTWNLGSGMADLLVTHLLDSGRFTVIERKQLDKMIGEIRLQDGDLFRKEGKVEPGRLKNAQYLIRGVVTDFTVTRDASGWFSKDSTAAKLVGSNARVAINLMIFDVETGEVLESVEAAGSAGAFGLGGSVNYQDYAFGSEAFFRTPLGKACGSAMKKAIVDIHRAIPDTPWTPRVAETHPTHIVISGGRNLGLREGDRFVVRGEPRQVTDPVTGDVIHTESGPVKGELVVTAIDERVAHARILRGKAKRGDRLEKVEGP